MDIELQPMFSVKKLNGRLWIVDSNDMPVYTPPEFVRHLINNRNDLQNVADRFNEKQFYCIDAIREFETQLRSK